MLIKVATENVSAVVQSYRSTVSENRSTAVAALESKKISRGNAMTMKDYTVTVTFKVYSGGKCSVMSALHK